MKKANFKWIVVIISAFLVSTCAGDDDFDITICPRRCPSTEPWIVDYLEAPPPCFKTKEECLEYARTHGFADNRCIRCDY